MAKSISYRRLPEMNPIFLDYVENSERVRSFYAVDYRQPLNRWERVREVGNLFKKELKII